MSGLTRCLPTVSLPWQGLKAGNKKQKYEKISERKIATSTEVTHCSLLTVFPSLVYMFLLCFPNCRPSVVDILLSLLLTSITVAHYVLKMHQTINTWRDCSETFLFGKVGLICPIFHLMINHVFDSQCSKMLTRNYVIHWAGFQFDYVFDWTILKYQQAQMTTAPPRAIVSTMNKMPSYHTSMAHTWIFFFLTMLMPSYLGSTSRTELWDGSCGK